MQTIGIRTNTRNLCLAICLALSAGWGLATINGTVASFRSSPFAGDYRLSTASSGQFPDSAVFTGRDKVMVILKVRHDTIISERLVCYGVGTGSSAWPIVVQQFILQASDISENSPAGLALQNHLKAGDTSFTVGDSRSVSIRTEPAAGNMNKITVDVQTR